jgi:hypothetical protein
MVLFCVALLCSVVPRKVGCKDLTPWDFTLWVNILPRMRSYEEAQDDGWRQPVAHTKQ